MKITYSGKQKKKNKMEFELQRAKANEGCNMCPECGETRKYKEKWFSSSKYGIRKFVYPTLLPSDMSPTGQNMYKDSYYCHTCGCEYESEPYKPESYYKAHLQ